MNSKLRIKIRKILEESYDYYPDFYDPLYNPNIHGFKGFTDRLGKQQLGEEVLEEKAATFLDIPPSVGLVRRIDGPKVYLHLFDFKEQKCFGSVIMYKLSNRSYMVTEVASEKGFGPLMLEIAMMGVSPSGICLDRVGPSTNVVWNIFKKFIDERSDIKKEKIKASDMEYDGRYSDDEERDYLYNIICFRSPSTWYNKMIERGYRLAIDSGFENEYGDSYPAFITKACRNYFSSKYKG